MFPLPSNFFSLFASLFFYLVYLSVEVYVVMKMNKKHHA